MAQKKKPRKSRAAPSRKKTTSKASIQKARSEAAKKGWETRRKLSKPKKPSKPSKPAKLSKPKKLSKPSKLSKPKKPSKLSKRSQAAKKGWETRRKRQKEALDLRLARSLGFSLEYSIEAAFGQALGEFLRQRYDNRRFREALWESMGVTSQEELERVMLKEELPLDTILRRLSPYQSTAQFRDEAIRLADELGISVTSVYAMYNFESP